MQVWQYIVSIFLAIILLIAGWVSVIYITKRTDKLNFTNWIFSSVIFAVAFGIDIALYLLLPFNFVCLILMCAFLGLAFGLICGHANYRFLNKQKYGTNTNLL